MCVLSPNLSYLVHSKELGKKSVSPLLHAFLPALSLLPPVHVDLKWGIWRINPHPDTIHIEKGCKKIGITGKESQSLRYEKNWRKNKLPFLVLSLARSACALASRSA